MDVLWFMWYATEYLCYLCIIIHTLAMFGYVKLPETKTDPNKKTAKPDIKEMMTNILGSLSGDQPSKGPQFKRKIRG